MDSKRKIVAGITAVALLAGAGGVYAATNDDGDGEREAFRNDVAKRLNVTPGKLDEAVQGAFEDRIDAAVKAGKLTEEQAEEIKKRAKEKGGVPFGPPGFGHGGPKGPGGPGKLHLRHHGGPGGGVFGAGADAAAKYLGVSKEDLFKAHRDGKSLAEVAKSKGKSVDGLKDAIRDAVEAKLDKAVKDEDLTDKQRDQILERFDEHIDDLVNGKRPKGGKGEKGFRMHKFGDGPPGPPPGIGPGSFDAAPAPPPEVGI